MDATELEFRRLIQDLDKRVETIEADLQEQFRWRTAGQLDRLLSRAQVIAAIEAL